MFISSIISRQHYRHNVGRTKYPSIVYKSTCIIATFFLALDYITITQSSAEIVNHVTCGSVIKLKNEAKPKVRLHSHDIKYGSGSGQQSVTAAENQDTNSYW